MLLSPAAFYTEPMPPKPLSAEYFDGWYADRVAAPAVDEIMNRHMGFRPGTRAGVLTAEAIPELAGELRLTAGSTLLDLACGRGAYGLLIAQQSGASLIGVDFSAQALAEAGEQAATGSSVRRMIPGWCSSSARGCSRFPGTRPVRPGTR